MGHYRLIVGYSDQESSFYVFDSFLGDGDGQGIRQAYDTLDALWQQFDRVYVVVYPEAQEAQVAHILSEDWDPDLNAQHALRAAQVEAEADHDNKFAWFNLGTAFVLNGQYDQAAIAYDQARNLELPWRMLWYQFGPFEAYLNTNRLDDVIALALANHNTTQQVEETYYYWGLALAEQGEYAEAEMKFEQAINLNGHFDPAHQALQALPQ
jgi:tetratricopeptide (TPR) repeat protein